jgi:hypothetical protein
MVRDEDGKRMSSWRTSYRPFSPKALEQNHLTGWNDSLTLDVRPSETCRYDQEGLGKLKARRDVFCIPTLQNEVGLDSFIWHQDHLYVFQFTIAKRHGIKDGPISMLEQCPKLPPRSNWRFIFVISDDVDVLECPYPQTPVLQELRPFSSIVRMEEYRLKVIERLGDKEPVARRLRSVTKPAEQSSTRTMRKKAGNVSGVHAAGRASESRRSAGKGKQKEVQ